MGPRSAVVSWDPVSPKSVRGEFKGYKIQTWTAESGAEKFREFVIMRPDSSSHLVQSFKPNSLNFVRILAFNGAYNGPPSNTITIQTPEGIPGKNNFYVKLNFHLSLPICDLIFQVLWTL